MQVVKFGNQGIIKGVYSHAKMCPKYWTHFDVMIVLD